jgi:hypothetical protein
MITMTTKSLALKLGLNFNSLKIIKLVYANAK